MATVRRIVGAKKPGTEVVFTIIREGSERKVTVTLSEAPSEAIASVDESTSKKNVERLGMEVSNVNSDLASKYGLGNNDKGVVVTGVERNGAAFSGGLREGDLIKRVGKDDISNVKDYTNAINKIQPGETALFLVYRRGSSMFIAFTVPK
jgi:S1-C subfamily serine protease